MLDTSQHDYLNVFSPILANPLHLYSHPGDGPSHTEMPESVYHDTLLEFCRANLLLGDLPTSSPAVDPYQSVLKPHADPLPGSWPIKPFRPSDPTGNVIPPRPVYFAVQGEPSLKRPLSPKLIVNSARQRSGISRPATVCLQVPNEIPITQPTPVHPIILRSNLRHLPFPSPDWPRLTSTTGLPRKSPTQVCAGYRQAGRTATEVAFTRAATGDKSAAGDECADLWWRNAGRGEPQRPWQPTDDHDARVLPKATSNMRKTTSARESVPSPASFIRGTDPHRRQHLKRARDDSMQPVSQLKRVGAVALPTAAQWASELGTFQYLFDSHRLDDGASNRLAKLLGHINDRKRDVSGQVLKVVGSGLSAKLQFVQRCSAFGSDCQEMAADILGYWTSAGLLR